MKKSLLFCLVISAVFSLHAQSDFRPGFIITNEGDSIAGQIDYRPNAKNYNSCLFKKTNGEEVEYFPDQLIGYGYLNDKYFVSGIEDGVFVEQLIEGPISLFKKDAIFYMEKDEDIHRLEYKEAGIDIHRNTIPEDNKWRGIVTYLISDCLENYATLTRNLPLTEKKLASLTSRYNKCTGDTRGKVFKDDKAWSKTKIGFAVGLMHTTLKVKRFDLPERFDYLADSYGSSNPMFGFVMSISSPRISERFSFQPEIHLIKSSFSGFEEIPSSTQIERNDTFIDLTTISIPVSIKYTLPQNPYGLFLQAGFHFDFNISTSSGWIREREILNSSLVLTSPEVGAFEIANNYAGIIAAIGLVRSFEKFDGSLSLRSFRGMSDLNAGASRAAIGIKHHRIGLSLTITTK